MEHQLDPRHAEVARKATELIQRSINFGKNVIQRVVLGAAEGLEPKEESKVEEEV